MGFHELLRQKNRMCKQTKCINCGLSSDNNFSKEKCSIFCDKYPEKAEDIIKKWAYEHPEEQYVTTEDKPKTYEQGLEDAWEFARDIWMKYVGGQLEEIFGTMEADEIMEKYTVKEAMQKLQEWEDKQIKVGDVVRFVEDPDTYMIVTDIDYSGSIYGINKKGKVYLNKNPKDWEKTRRNVSGQLNALLEAAVK